MVLSANEISEQIKLCEKEGHKFIDPYNEDRLQPASYDLTLGDEYYICSEKTNPDIKKLKEDEDINVPPRSTFFVISREKLYMPSNICASVSLAFRLIKKGIVFSVQPPIDPGYHGAIVALLHNMSDETIVIKHGQHILNIVYYKLEGKVSENNSYHGQYNEITLEKFCTEAIKQSAIQNLTKEAKDASYEALAASETAKAASDEAKTASKTATDASNDAKKASDIARASSHKTLSTIITIVTIILAVLTVLLTIVTVYLALKAFH